MMNQNQEYADDCVHKIIKSKVIELHSKKSNLKIEHSKHLSWQEREVEKDFDQANGKEKAI